MKLFKVFSFITTTLVGIGALRTILNKYKLGFYYIDKEEEKELLEELQHLEENALDLRGTPTHECVCGSRVWNLVVSFEDYEISNYLLEMECAQCGSWATAPTPLDRENME